MSRNRNSRENNGKRSRGGERKRSSSRRVIEELTGRVAMTREGYAFIIVPDKEDDIFIPQKKLRGALNNDTVQIAVTQLKDRGRRTEGEVLSIVERSKKPFIGILQIIGQQAWVIVESRVMPYDIQVPIEQVSKEHQGLKVAVLVKDWPRGSENPHGNVVDILGTPGENNTEMHAILTEFGLPYRFTDGVETAAAKIPIEIPEKEIKNRKDFRKTLTITIDPFDAKDFDDAISFRTLENGNMEVGVHIADVTHYVTPGDIVDNEAIERGTSVYLVDRTVPMLPEVLSNNLCSLRPNEDKLTFSAVFELNAKGKIISEWFGRTVINSDRRFAYEQAQEIIETNGEYTLDYPVDGSRETVQKKISDKKAKGEKFSGREVADALLTLHKLAATLREQRFAHGSLSFERPEMKVIVDAQGKPVDVIQKISKDANWLIEEYMLLANKQVATYITKGMRLKDPTFVYRIHDEPNFDKIQNLRDFVKHFGYSMGPTENARQVARELNQLLEKAHGTPQGNAIEIIALRSMARARYSTDNVGHYGLGFDYYTHFTSPIRRYPDMMVHRLLAHYLDKGRSENKAKYEELCKHSSNREQLATEAERSSIKYKLTEFMQDKIGNVYDGSISGITEWGMYVEIEPTHVEGMVMLREIREDFFVYDEKNYCVTGKSTRKKFTLGDKVKIKVAKANVEQKLIDFALIWDPAWNKGERRERRPRRESSTQEQTERRDSRQRSSQGSASRKNANQPDNQPGQETDAKERSNRNRRPRAEQTAEQTKKITAATEAPKQTHRKPAEHATTAEMPKRRRTRSTKPENQDTTPELGSTPAVPAKKPGFYEAVVGKAKSVVKRIRKK